MKSSKSLKSPPAPLFQSGERNEVQLRHLFQSSGRAGVSHLETEVILSHVLGISRAMIRARPEQIMNSEDQKRFNSLIYRRLQKEPLAYILEEKEFWSLSLQVNSDVLIPRPETEILVEAVLQRLPDEPGIQILDLGTGSGAIALALAVERPHWQIIATDKSSDALAVAIENAKKLAVTNVKFLCGDWFSPLLERPIHQRLFHAVVSNPPYVSADDFNLNQNELQFEPEQALIAGESGFQDLRQIVTQASDFLVSKAWLFLEHGYNQREQVLFLLRKCGFIETHDLKDLAGLDRVAIGQKL